ncbi:hypothetical protein LCGC14_1985080, partial [marine sediment metagenome]
IKIVAGVFSVAILIAISVITYFNTKQKEMPIQTNIKEELVIEKILFEYTSYFDASNEWKGPEWLPYLNEMRIHNSKGELLERRVYNGRTGIHQRAKITKYNPPGRFVGEIIRSEGYGYY